MERSEIIEVMRKLKLGKTPGPDGITAEMLKCGGEIDVDWMMWICNLAWEQSKVRYQKTGGRPSLYRYRKEKAIERETCNNYRGISLLRVPGKIYRRILNERTIKITDKSEWGEQGGFWKSRRCIDHIFVVEILVEKYLEKVRKLFAAFVELEKAYDTVDRKGLWDTLRLYGMGGNCLRGSKPSMRIQVPLCG